jgi:hypothetical protein
MLAEETGMKILLVHVLIGPHRRSSPIVASLVLHQQFFFQCLAHRVSVGVGGTVLTGRVVPPVFGADTYRCTP